MLFLLACRCAVSTPSDSAAPDPWVDWPLTPVSELREMLWTELPLSAPRRLKQAPDRPLLFVLDQDRTLVLDERYENSTRRYCLRSDRFESTSEGGERQGDCAAGEVRLQRGLQPRWAALAWDQDAQVMWGVRDSGQLYYTPLDLRETHPWDWLEPVFVADLGLSEVVDAQIWDGTLQVLAGQELISVDTRTFQVDAQQLPSLGTVLAEGVVGTQAGVWMDGALDPVGPVFDLSWGEQGLWVALGEQGLLGPQGQTLPDSAWRVSAETGVYVVGEQGLWTFEQETPTLAQEGSFIDVATLPTHEVILLEPTGVRVFVDERPLLEGEPLQIWVQTFLEKPRTPDEDVPCEGDPSVALFVESATHNAELLTRLPSSIALDVTPQFARRAGKCGYAEQVRAVANQRRLELGVLYHEVPFCGGDQGCLVEYLELGAADVEALLGPAGHVSGLYPVWDQGDVWVEALVASSVPSLAGFSGMSLLADVPHMGDPRSKERWPQSLGPTLPWQTSASAHAELDDGGPLRMLPADTRAGFSYAGCGSLLLRECFVLGQGQGMDFSERDIQQLDLALHRALALREPGAVWSFHLPDLGAWDYVDGCDTELQAGCDAALLLAWQIDVHARWVQSGAAVWGLPSD